MLKLRFTLSKAMLFLSSFKASGITFVSLLILMSLSLLLKKNMFYNIILFQHFSKILQKNFEKRVE
ncbi:hypothetical protein D7Y07_16990 [Bacteroides acidifaciens]|uniref:Uncharacterized protein n=1 Tax=Bacteroides acidifaciens TaxID=85831 RepID=A0A3L8A5F4_9BACE|nr:hypothetical protein D7Y07_16990 [Bacteroides acidifaciens]